MKPPYSLTDEELWDYAEEHIQYEIDMLTWSAGILASVAAHKGQGFLPWAINNGLLNTFAIHARNLIDFLYSRSRGKDYPTDIVIQDYIDDETAIASIGQIPARLGQALTKANKQVAHLSRERIDYEKAGKEWNFIEVSHDIRAALASVADNIPPSRITDKLRSKLSKADVEIPVVDVTISKTSAGEPIGVSFALRIR